MLRFFKPRLLALALGLGLVCAFPAATAAGVLTTQTNQVILSCTDGHSVILWVDSATLSSLTADVAAINGSGTGTSCGLKTTASNPPDGAAEGEGGKVRPEQNGEQPPGRDGEVDGVRLQPLRP